MNDVVCEVAHHGARGCAVHRTVLQEQLVSERINLGLQVFGQLSEGAGDAAGESRLVILVDGGHLELVVCVKWSVDRLEVGGASEVDVDERLVLPALGIEGVGLGDGLAPAGGVLGQVNHLSVGQGVEGLDVHQRDFGWR